MGSLRLDIWGSALLVCAVAGCGGGSVASTPPPVGGPSGATPTPSPPVYTPAPTALVNQNAPSVSLQAPVLVTSPAEPTASSGGATFANVATGTVFPLLSSTVKANFDGDPVTTQLGSTIQKGEGQTVLLTINNPELGVVNEASNVETKRADGTTRSTYQFGDNLDYTRYGFWSIGGFYSTGENTADSLQLASGNWATGLATPASEIPVSGVASYAGTLVLTGGSYFASCRCAPTVAGGGAFEITSDFGARRVDGLFSGMKVSDGFPFTYLVPDLRFSASFDPLANLFSGPVTVGTSTTRVGDASGRFFGPAAAEVGGVFTYTGPASIEGTTAGFDFRLLGAFGGRRK